LGSQYNHIATQAANELNIHGWLQDGSLKFNEFTKSDLSNTYLFQVDFEGAVFKEVNFSNANLRHANFKNAKFEGKIIFDNTILAYANFEGCSSSKPLNFLDAYELGMAIMRDGKRYDGRYRLKGDLKMFKELFTKFGVTMSWPDFYGVTEDEFDEGQKWANENTGPRRFINFVKY